MCVSLCYMILCYILTIIVLYGILLEVVPIFDLMTDNILSTGGMALTQYIRLMLMSIMLVLALISDIKYLRIRNLHVAVFSVAGLIITILTGDTNDICPIFSPVIGLSHFISFSPIIGLSPFIDFLLSIAVPFFLLFPIYCLRMLGAGDIKLFCAIGAIMGFPFVLESMACSFLSGGIIALSSMMLRKNLRTRLSCLYQYIKSCILTRSFQPYTTASSNTFNGSYFRFSPAIVSGSFIVAFFRYFAIIEV